MSKTRSPDYPDPHVHDTDGPTPQLDKREATEAIRGQNVRIVLLAGTIGAAIAVGLAYLFFFGA